jgi:nitroreductase/NAD-dependent dihydropyrimidine dehydrogenase PreA subunit
MISIDESRCNLCGLCVPVCVRRILVKGEKSVKVTDPSLCLECGHCKAVCPTDAPQLPGMNEQFQPAPLKEEIPGAADLFRFFRRRRSLRVYRPDPVEKEKLKMLIEAGRYAPTGSNRQACEYLVVSGRKILDQVCALATQALQEEGGKIQKSVDQYRQAKKPLPEDLDSQQFFPAVWERIAKKWKEGTDQLLHRAPALVLIHIKEHSATTAEIDAGIAATHMMLLAEALGLGTCFIAFLVRTLQDSKELRSLLKIPDGNRVYVAFTVGYPAVTYLRLTGRRPAKIKWIGEFSD